jgi:hypothetical protein
MKRLPHRLAGRGPFGFGAPITTTLLLLTALAASAQTTPCTSTGWVNGVQFPGMFCTNALGQVFARGIVHTARVQATDPRVTGQVLIITEGAMNADGTANLQGQSYLQVGTWDPAGTTFTPTGGLWQMNWHGVMQTDYSIVNHIAGYGSGGTIDGLRLEQTLTRAAAQGPIDPTIPYLYTGTIKPAPLNMSQVLDNFDDNWVTGWTADYNHTKGTGGAIEANGQFTVWGSFPGVITTSSYDSYVLMMLGEATLRVEDGQTLEVRADLVGLNDDAAAANMSLGGTAGLYFLSKTRDSIALAKWTPGNHNSFFACETAAVRNTDVILALALTRVAQNVIVTARVLDKADPNVVLYARTVVDTPTADPSLTADEYAQVSGMHLLGINRDAAGQPPTAFRPGLWVFQYNDGTKERAEATFDNLELRTSEIPPVGIERAVRLSWPASATINYAVEGGPTVQGPWLPVQDQTIPGFQTMTVPATGPARFFRLIQAP